MHMTFEKIDPPEHPAARAARMIKQLHNDTIAKIQDGHVFEKDGVNVNADVVAACREQIALCDAVAARAPHMPVSLAGDAFMILKELEDVLEQKKEMKVVPDEQLPEIGNYDHGKT